MLNNEIIKKLIETAFEMRERAYVPYSKFNVGASILVDDSKIFGGCNVENASFGATNCAERTAIFKAVSEGYKELFAVCVIGSSEDYSFPCGICRQVISEFAHDENMPVIIAQSKEKYIIHKLSEVLPLSFTQKNLKV